MATFEEFYAKLECIKKNHELGKSSSFFSKTTPPQADKTADMIKKGFKFYQALRELNQILKIDDEVLSATLEHAMKLLDKEKLHDKESINLYGALLASNETLRRRLEEKNFQSPSELTMFYAGSCLIVAVAAPLIFAEGFSKLWALMSAAVATNASVLTIELMACLLSGVFSLAVFTTVMLGVSAYKFYERSNVLERASEGKQLEALNAFTQFFESTVDDDCELFNSISINPILNGG